MHDGKAASACEASSVGGGGGGGHLGFRVICFRASSATKEDRVIFWT